MKNKYKITKERQEVIINYLKKFIKNGVIDTIVLNSMKLKKEIEENEYEIDNNILENICIILDEEERLFAYDWLDENEIKLIDTQGKVINDTEQIESDIKNSYEKEAKEFSKYPEKLTREKEIELFKIMENGTEKERKKAREQLINHNLRLAKWVSNRYYTNYIIEPEDKEEIARIGLINAVDHFDYTRGFHFSTFGVKVMYNMIDKIYFEQNQFSITKNYMDLIDAVKRTQNQLFREFEKNPTDKELADTLDLSVYKIREIKKIMQYENILSFDYLLEKKKNKNDAEITEEIEGEQYSDGIYYDENRENMISDYLNIEEDESAGKLVEYSNFIDCINKVLSTLSDREQKVLRLRFGLEDGKTRTLEEVGVLFDVTKERIRQIECKALRKLRHPTRSGKLFVFLEEDFSKAASQYGKRLNNKDDNTENINSEPEEEIQFDYFEPSDILEDEELFEEEQITNANQETVEDEKKGEIVEEEKSIEEQEKVQSEKSFDECSDEELKKISEDKIEKIKILNEKLQNCRGNKKLYEIIAKQLKVEIKELDKIKEELYKRIK